MQRRPCLLLWLRRRRVELRLCLLLRRRRRRAPLPPLLLELLLRRRAPLLVRGTALVSRNHRHQGPALLQLRRGLLPLLYLPGQLLRLRLPASPAVAATKLLPSLQSHGGGGRSLWQPRGRRRWRERVRAVPLAGTQLLLEPTQRHILFFLGL